MTTAELTDKGIDRLRRIDRVFLLIATILALVALLDIAALPVTIRFALAALAGTAPYMLFAVFLIGFLKATGSERLLADAFKGQEVRMIVVAALIGSLAPFCSCEIIPFIAGLIALGTPLSAIMALWLSSPLMDPSVLLITAGELGWAFAIAKTAAAIVLGLAGGFAVRAASKAGYFRQIARPQTRTGGCCGARKPFSGKPVWRFWQVSERRAVFAEEAWANGLFLLKWLTFAYLLEALMVRYVPAETVAGLVGGEGALPVVISAFVGAPAYLNGYAAPAIVSGFVEHGMSGGAAMAFVIAGGVTSIPAMTAVFALVTRQVFLAYLALGVSGAIIAGLFYNAALALS